MTATLLRKLCQILTFTFLINARAFSQEIDSRVFSSFEEVNAYETAQILELSSSSYEELADAYMNRGESYLLKGTYNWLLKIFKMDMLLQNFVAMN